MEKYTHAVLSDDCRIDDLLDAIKTKLAADSSLSERIRVERMGHYGWASNVIANALNVRRSSLTTRQMVDNERQIKRYIARQRISNHAKSMLRCYRNGMIREAKELGWSPETFALEKEWKPALDAVRGVPCGLSIIQKAINNNLRMCEFSDHALDEWGNDQVSKGRTRGTVISRKSAFRGAIRNAGLQARFPLLATSLTPTFRAGAKELPQWLRGALAIMLWNLRQEAHLDGTRFPFSSARGLVLRFRELFGYAKRIYKMEITSFDDLLAESLIRKYILFLHDEKEWNRESIRSSLNRIANALGSHPSLGERDFEWIKTCVKELPEDDDTNIDPEFDGREILLDDLATIPAKILAKRNKLKTKNPRIHAWLALKEFVIFFLVTHPWPPQCLRTCRITAPKGNLFVGPVPQTGGPFALFPVLKKELRKNPALQFWQFLFSPDEVQLGRYARGAVLPRLVSKLEPYLKHRKVLLNGKPDPGTLLVNLAGQPFACGEFAKFVADICHEYLGRRVTPSEFRRKFLFDWLTEYPGDEENIATILWINPQSVNAEYKRGNPNSESTSNGSSRRWVRNCRSYWE